MTLGVIDGIDVTGDSEAEIDRHVCPPDPLPVLASMGISQNNALLGNGRIPEVACSATAAPAAAAIGVGRAAVGARRRVAMATVRIPGSNAFSLRPLGSEHSGDTAFLNQRLDSARNC